MSESRSSEPVNILLVDDTPENLLALEAVLEAPEYRLIKARSGKEALGALLRQDFALILLDIHMPELNGYDTAVLIKGRERSREIPIVFITAISKDDESIQKAYEVGGVDFISKPFDPVILRKKVAAYVALYRRRHEFEREAALQRKSIEKERAEYLAREKAAREQAERLAATFEAMVGNAPVGMAIIDPQLRYAHVNKSLAEMNGFPVEYHLGKTVREVIGDLADGTEPVLRMVLETGASLLSREYEVFSPGAPDRKYYLRASYYPVRTASGKIIGIGAVAVDLTQQKTMEEALRRGQERFELALKAAEIGVFETDIGTGMTTWSDREYKIMGIDPSIRPVPHELFRNTLHPDDRERLDETMAAAIQERKDAELDFRVLGAGGKVRWVKGSGRIFYKPDGTPDRMVGTNIDVTEEKEAEEALRRSAEQYRELLQRTDRERRLYDTILSSQQDFLYLIDRDYRFVYANPSLLEFWGKAIEQVKGRNLAELGFSRDLVEYHTRRFQEVFTGKVVRGENVFTDRKGVTRCLEQIFVPVLDARGKVEAIAGSTRDITLRKKAENALAESEQKFRLLTEAALTLSSSLDYGTTLRHLANLIVPRFADWCIIKLIEEGEFKRAAVVHRDPEKARLAQRFESLRGRPESEGGAAEAIREGKAVIWTAGPGQSDTRQSAVAMAGIQDSEQLLLIEQMGLHSYLAVPMKAREQVIGAILLISESPQREYGRAEEELAVDLARIAGLAVDNARLYRASKQAIDAREEILAVVSHDLKNPLSSIALNAQFIEKALRLPDRKELILQQGLRIRSAAQRMEALIQDVLDASKMGAGGFGVEAAETRVESLLAGAEEILQPIAEARKIRLTTVVEGNCSDVYCDRSQIMRVLGNLIGNAIKFSPEGSSVQIGARACGEEVEFWVRDSGRGIPDEEKPHIFDRFWQKRDTANQGTGLGLYISRGIVQAHGGRIWVDSVYREGATFHFTLPGNAPGEGARRAA